MAMDSSNSHICQSAGHCTLTELSDKAAPIETQLYRSLTICSGIRPEERLGRNQPQSTQWSHNTMWNKRYMEPRPGYALQQLWANSESAIAQKTSPSYDVNDNDIRRTVMALTAVPAATLPESAFLLAQTGSLAQRAIEEWERNLCENKAVALLEQMQARKPALIKKMEERCSLPWCLIGHSRSQKHWLKLLMPDHQDHARQTEAPSYCTNDQAGGKR